MRRMVSWRKSAAATLCCLSVLLLAGGPAGAATADLFPAYDAIKPNIAFWKKIYSEYSTSQGLLHDNRNLAVIYGEVELVGQDAPRARQTNRRRIEAAKEKYQRILEKLAAGRAPSTAEEKRVLALFGPAPEAAMLREAIGNIRFQLGQKNRFRQGIIRSGAFLEEMKEIIRSYDLPEDLAYLPHVESSFNYQAYSKFGAAGIWQFTHATGKRYMTVDYVLDERRDPLRATHAAARYLKESYERLRCWPSAITSYNHGQAGMGRALKAQGTFEQVFLKYNGGYFKFASRNFYAEYLAAREVAKNYRRHFGELKLAEPVRTSKVKLAGFVPVTALAAHFREDAETIRRLNPALREPVFTGQKYVPKGYELRLPYRPPPQLTTLVAGLAENLYQDRQKRSRFYRVQQGDTAGLIARRQNVALRDLLLANQLDRRATIYVGQNLRIPTPDEIVTLAARNFKREAVAAATSTAAAVPAEIGRLAMAELPEESVQAAQEQQEVLVAAVAASEPEPAEPPVALPASRSPAVEVNPAVVVGNFSVEKVVRKNGRTSGTIRVEPEETLGHYADWLGVATQDIRRLNGFRYGQAIRIDQEIKIPLDKVAKADFEEKRYEYHKEIEEDFFAAFESQTGRVYQVRKGDNIWSLCRNEFEVPFWLIRKYNTSLDFNVLKPAQEIIVPIVEKLNQG